MKQTFPTHKGELIVEGPVTAESLSQLTLDDDLRAFRPPKRQKEALIEISQIPNGRIVIARIGTDVVGYVTFHPPDAFERWAEGPPELLELGAIEVSPKVRGLGVGKKLLEVAFLDPTMENHLVIATEYYWHWDLERTGLRVWEYREVMDRLMSSAGLLIRETDDDEICSHPANMLTARYGKNLSQKSIEHFERILFLNSDRG
ncbi:MULTISPECIES: GNAT family N-acetyltransferase [Desulfitobacterium]|uniref:Acetyltransferase (GNAT) family protein n=1 Tax=Desulfitobacterium dehalogenans (strain ATCC 51507 / DSM 9161 / JW/IU-DC1) TaxID=756499 RepID=I4AA60_DESDJ|nr:MULTISPECIES: GNAT family N-acetyltransferase [Desulfitobacterium]AFM00845.1 acetyltransferase (GNAT) family protein [Desulfitobacterium dehalogenans ATCC 51507]